MATSVPVWPAVHPGPWRLTDPEGQRLPLCDPASGHLASFRSEGMVKPAMLGAPGPASARAGMGQRPAWCLLSGPYFPLKSEVGDREEPRDLQGHWSAWLGSLGMEPRPRTPTGHAAQVPRPTHMADHPLAEQKPQGPGVNTPGQRPRLPDG